MIKIVLVLTLSVGTALARAQEFKPYPEAHVSREQWATYFDQVNAKFGATSQLNPDGTLQGFTDINSNTQYVFTRPSHAAHPAWIARRVVTESGLVTVQMVGYFAGAEAPFSELYKAYAVMTQQLQQSMRKQAPKE